MTAGTPAAVCDYESAATASTHSKAVGTTVAIGTFLFVNAGFSVQADNATFADSKGNTYTAVAGSQFQTGNTTGNVGAVQGFYCKVTTALTATDTFTLTLSPNTQRATFNVSSITGIDPTTPVRVAASGTSSPPTTNNNAWTCPTVTPAVGDIILAFGMVGGATATVGSLGGGITLAKSIADNRTNILFYKVATSTSTVTASGTLNVSTNPWVGVSIVLRAAATNTAPTANAGSDQTGLEPFATVTLDGSGSGDIDVGDTITYAWTQTAGTTVTLSSSTAQKPTFAAPGVHGGDTLTFSLTVTDNHGAASTADTVSITVLPHTLFRLDSPHETPIQLVQL